MRASADWRLKNVVTTMHLSPVLIKLRKEDAVGSAQKANEVFDRDYMHDRMDDHCNPSSSELIPFFMMVYSRSFVLGYGRAF